MNSPDMFPVQTSSYKMSTLGFSFQHMTLCYDVVLCLSVCDCHNYYSMFFDLFVHVVFGLISSVRC